VVKRVTTLVTPGESIDVLVTDHGIAVNPARPELDARLREAGLQVMTIEELYNRAVSLSGVSEPIQFTDRIVALSVTGMERDRRGAPSQGMSSVSTAADGSSLDAMRILTARNSGRPRSGISKFASISRCFLSQS